MSIVPVHGPHTWGEPFFSESDEIIVNLIGDLYIEVKAKRTTGLADPDPYAWDFGDGSPAVNGQEVTHTYGQPDVYTITLQIQTTEGLVTDSVTITLNGGGVRETVEDEEAERKAA